MPAMHGDLRRLAAVLAETRGLAARDDVPPGDLVTLLLLQGYAQLHLAPPSEAAATVARLERLAVATPSVEATVSARFLAYRSAVIGGDADRAREWRERIRAAGEPPLWHAPHIGTLNAYAALLEGDAARAVAEARAVLAAAGEVMPAYRPIWLANLGQALLEQGDAAGAVRELDAAIAAARSLRIDGMAVSALLLRAAARLRMGDGEGADASLCAGLAAARSVGCVPHLPYIVPGLLAQIAARALARGIERDFVRRVVARRGVAPPAAEEERWPWQVRVRALGGFEVAVDGRPLENGAKSQRKPIDLLKYLVSSGGREVSFGAVTQALWPEAEGDAAKRSLDVTLHRLRRLLGHDEAVLLAGGKLTLNAALVWVDARAFDRLAARAEDEQHGGAAVPVEVLERALRLYRGALLEADDDAWVQPARDRLRRRFLHLAEALGERWEDAGNRDAALAWYHRAVAIEPAAERLHQRIIRLLHAQGRTAEAVDAYRRCRYALAAVLGAPPSPETEALHHRVLGA
jgi:DNA-binding SARP family transcriptional activator